MSVLWVLAQVFPQRCGNGGSLTSLSVLLIVASIALTPLLSDIFERLRPVNNSDGEWIS